LFLGCLFTGDCTGNVYLQHFTRSEQTYHKKKKKNQHPDSFIYIYIYTIAVSTFALTKKELGLDPPPHRCHHIGATFFIVASSTIFKLKSIFTHESTCLNLYFILENKQTKDNNRKANTP
jgi:hypothetical protein